MGRTRIVGSRIAVQTRDNSKHTEVSIGAALIGAVLSAVGLCNASSQQQKKVMAGTSLSGLLVVVDSMTIRRRYDTSSYRSTTSMEMETMPRVYSTGDLTC